MSIQRVHGAHAAPLGLRRRRPHAPAAPPAPAPKGLPPIGAPSDVGGEWPINYADARKYAKRTLDQIDWSKPDLVLWVSGTANPKKGEFPQIAPDFANAIYRVYQEGGASLNLLRYESSWNMRTSMATGVETLRLVLQGIAARKGGQRVLLAGESQGAWVISEALKDPVSKAAVTRTAIWGHPSVAATHFHAGTDPKVMEVNHKFDRVAMPIGGDRALAMDAMIAMETNLTPAKLPIILRALLQNPAAGLLEVFAHLRDMLPPNVRPLLPEPHNYSKEFLAGAHFLRDGKVGAALLES